MNGTTYTPRADSVAARCITFFKANPDEELTLEDIQDKFDAVRGNIHTLLTPAREAGFLSRDKNEDGEYLYKAGPKCSKAAILPVGPFGAPPQRRRVSAPAVELPDPLQVEIRDDVPIPGQRVKRDWLPLLKRLVKPGQSACLPIQARHTLSQAATQAKKDGLGEYTIRTDQQAQTVTVWRAA